MSVRATILVTAEPGSGPRLVQAVADDPRVARAMATLGDHEAVFEVVGADHHDLLEVIANINAQPEQIASETLLDMMVHEAPELRARSKELAGAAREGLA